MLPTLLPDLLATETPATIPPPDVNVVENGTDYIVAVVDMWGCAYGQIDQVQVTQVEWQLDDKGSAAFTFPIQQMATTVWGVPIFPGPWPAGGTPATCLANNVRTIPLTVVAGVNDEFVYTAVGADPVTYTVAPGTYTTGGALLTAVQAAIGSDGTSFAFVQTVSLAISHFQFTSVIPGAANNGATITEGTHDIAASLGFGLNPNTFTGGADATSPGGLSNRAILPGSCIPGGREIQVWRNQKLIWWGVPISASPSPTLVTIACEGLLWWVDGVMFGPTLSPTLVDGDFEVSGALGDLDTYWPPSSGDLTSSGLADALAGDPGVVTGRWAAVLTCNTAEEDAFIEERYIVDTEMDGQDITITAWVYISQFLGEAIDGRGLMAVLYENADIVTTWQTGLTADMAIETELQISLDIGPLAFIRSHILPAPIYTLGVRLYCPEGGVTWDNVQVNIAPAPWNGTPTQLATQLIEYAQDPDQAKSTFAMDVNVIGTPPPQVFQRDYLGQSANSSVLGAFAEFVAGGFFDYEVTWDPTGHFRTFTIYCPGKGSMKYNYPLTLGTGDITDLSGIVDGSAVGTTQRVLGQGSSGSGNETAYRAFGGFLASGRGAGFPGGRHPRIVTDGVLSTVAGVDTETLTSATADFDSTDVGQPVTCLEPGQLPPGTTIAEILSSTQVLVTCNVFSGLTSVGGSDLTISIGGFTIEQQTSAQTNQPPGALAGLAQGNLVRNAASQAVLAPKVAANGTDYEGGSTGWMGNVDTGDVVPVSIDYGWLQVQSGLDGQPILQRVVGLTLYPVTEEIQPALNVLESVLTGGT